MRVQAADEFPSGVVNLDGCLIRLLARHYGGVSELMDTHGCFLAYGIEDEAHEVRRPSRAEGADGWNGGPAGIAQLGASRAIEGRLARPWAGGSAVSVLAGLRARAGPAGVSFARGVGLTARRWRSGAGQVCVGDLDEAEDWMVATRSLLCEG